MKLIPDNFVQPSREMRIQPRVLALSGGVLLVLVVSALWLSLSGKSDTPPLSEYGAQLQTDVHKPEQSSTGASAPSTEAGALAPAAETAAKTSPETVTPPTPSEKQKLFDAMQKQAQ